MAKTKKTTKTSRKAAPTKKKKAASPKKKAAVKKTAKKKTPVKKTPAKKKATTSGQDHAAGRMTEQDAAVPTMDRRAALRGDQRKSPDRRVEHQPVKVERRQLQRREKVNRRRQIDPTTCERDYTVDEVEFMQALDEYKRKSGRMFPTCSEILEVICGIGYSKQPATTSQADGRDFAPPAPPAPSAEPFEESLATLV